MQSAIFPGFFLPQRKNLSRYIFFFSQNAPSKQFKSNVRETWRVILVSEADIFFTESLRILAERLSQSETRLPLRQICYYSPPEDVGVFSTEIKFPLQNNCYNQVIYRTADNADRHCHKKQAVEQVISVFLVSAGTKNQAAAG